MVPFSDALSIGRRVDGTRAELTVSGELDHYSAPALLEAVEGLRERNVAHTVIDMAGVSFVDSAGLRALLLARGRGADGASAVRFVNVSRNVQRLFDMTGLRTVLLGDD
ncbi:MAG: STAS domain-containing protein [Acidimicrobiia bacterium]